MARWGKCDGGDLPAHHRFCPLRDPESSDSRDAELEAASLLDNELFAITGTFPAALCRIGEGLEWTSGPSLD